ncbi:MAG: NINE protein [Atopobiaceae bacterium]|nr:NINE protein [Atopobiaceae bacterium]
MGSAWLDVLLCFVFGIVGAHRFRHGQIGWGIVYVFTAGLFGIGWFIDLIRLLFIALNGERVYRIYGLAHFLTEPATPVPYTAPTYTTTRSYPPNPNNTPPATIPLQPDEQVLYSGQASYADITRSRQPMANGTETDYFPGTLVITNKRVIFTGLKGALNRPIHQVTSTTPLADGVALQFSDFTYAYHSPDGPAVSQAVRMALSGSYDR